MLTDMQRIRYTAPNLKPEQFLVKKDSDGNTEKEIYMIGFEHEERLRRLDVFYKRKDIKRKK